MVIMRKRKFIGDCKILYNWVGNMKREKEIS